MSTVSAYASGASDARRRFLRPAGAQVWLTGGALLAILAGVLHLATEFHTSQALLFLVGVAAGLILYKAAFGFTSSWRELIEERRGSGVRAQMLMLGLTSVVFFPLLGGAVEIGARPLSGFVAPLGLSVLIGAFLFGVGMQIGGG